MLNAFMTSRLRMTAGILFSLVRNIISIIVGTACTASCFMGCMPCVTMLINYAYIYLSMLLK